MVFEKLIGIQPEAIDYSSARHTVKGIAMKGNLILLLESNRGDYTFPGGGIESGESHQETLFREVTEETGYICNVIGQNIGRVDLRRRDKYEEDKMYELISHYYLFDVTSSKQAVQLTKDEKVYELKPVWIELEEAIRRNRVFLEAGTTVDFWINQELYVMETIRDHIDNFNID